MPQKKSHGGSRIGAGRPKGSRMRRSLELADRLSNSGKCPVDALIRLADKAENSGDISNAIHAWKSILPYTYARPKAIEQDPEAALELIEAMTIARHKKPPSDATKSYRDYLIEQMERAF